MLTCSGSELVDIETTATNHNTEPPPNLWTMMRRLDGYVIIIIVVNVVWQAYNVFLLYYIIDIVLYYCVVRRVDVTSILRDALAFCGKSHFISPVVPSSGSRIIIILLLSSDRTWNKITKKQKVSGKCFSYVAVW